MRSRIAPTTTLTFPKTRLVLSGWPEPPGETMAARRDALVATQDHLRRAVVREPRGHAAVVGGLMTPAVEPGSSCGVVRPGRILFEMSGVDHESAVEAMRLASHKLPVATRVVVRDNVKEAADGHR